MVNTFNNIKNFTFNTLENYIKLKQKSFLN